MIYGITSKAVWELFYKEHGRIPTRKEFREIGNYSDRTYYRLKNAWLEEAKLRFDEEKYKEAIELWNKR